MDDFSPAKNLMTMCFTYYYVGKRCLTPGDLLVLETTAEACPLCGEGDGGVPKLGLLWPLWSTLSGKELPWLETLTRFIIASSQGCLYEALPRCSPTLGMPQPRSTLAYC